MAGEDLHTSRLVRKQGLKGPALLSGTGSTLEQNKVLCGGLLFYVISSLHTGVSEPSHEVLLKGVDRDPERLCLLLPYLPPLFPPAARGTSSKGLLLFGFPLIIPSFHLHFHSPHNNVSEEVSRLLKLHSSVFAEDTSHNQSCYVNSSDGLWHLIKSSIQMLILLQTSLPIWNPVLKSAAMSRTHQHHAMSDFSVFWKRQ